MILPLLEFTEEPALARTIEQRLADLAERKAKLISRETKLLNQKRRDDARQKIVVGGALIARAMQDKGIAEILALVLDQDVTREHDKAVISPLIELLHKIVQD